MTDLLLWIKLDEEGGIKEPHYAGDAGFDLAVSRPTDIYAGEPIPQRVPCGICIALPDTIAAFVISRSSAVQRGIIVVPTLIDPGWRGDMYVFAYNMSSTHVVLGPGDRIAQLVPLPALAQSLALKQVDTLPKSERGRRGFGSTGGTPNG